MIGILDQILHINRQIPSRHPTTKRMLMDAVSGDFDLISAYYANKRQKLFKPPAYAEFYSTLDKS